MTRRNGLLAALAILAAFALLYVVRAGTFQGPAAVATPTLTSGAVATASPTASPSPTPSASPLPRGTFENKILGYRITLPERYRLGGSRLTPGLPPYLGDDTYTPQTAQQTRERCLSDSGDVGFLTYAREDLTVRVLRNLNGLSAAAPMASFPPRCCRGWFDSTASSSRSVSSRAARPCPSTSRRSPRGWSRSASGTRPMLRARGAVRGPGDQPIRGRPGTSSTTSSSTTRRARRSMSGAPTTASGSDAGGPRTAVLTGDSRATVTVNLTRY